MQDSLFSIREATEADAESLYKLILAIAEHENQMAFVHTSVASLLRDGFGSNPRFGVLLAEANKNLVGYAS